MLKKKGVRNRRMSDEMKAQAKNLAMFGFSHRCIAQWLFKKETKDITTVTKSERVAVSQFLSNQKIKVTEWRNGLSPISKRYIRSRMKTKIRIAKHTVKRAVPVKKRKVA